MVGGFVALSVGTGIGAGVGIATGVAAGTCSALESAKDQGLVTEEQFEQVLRGVVSKISGSVELPPEAELADTAAECGKVLADLQKAAAGD